jgi:hypothetical protein
MPAEIGASNAGFGGFVGRLRGLEPDIAGPPVRLATKGTLARRVRDRLPGRLASVMATGTLAGAAHREKPGSLVVGVIVNYPAQWL